MRKTKPSLPEALQRGTKRDADDEGRVPRIPLFSSRRRGLAERVEKVLRRFGRRS